MTTECLERRPGPGGDPTETDWDDDDDDLDRLGEVLRYLSELDVMALAILAQLVGNSTASQTDIARALGVTRQDVHAAVIRACRKHPELRQVFTLLARAPTLVKERRARRG